MMQHMAMFVSLRTKTCKCMTSVTNIPH